MIETSLEDYYSTGLDGSGESSSKGINSVSISSACARLSICSVSMLA